MNQPNRSVIQLPYGSGLLPLDLADLLDYTIDVLLPQHSTKPGENPDVLVQKALSRPLGIGNPFEKISSGTRVGITINDKTRPVPNSTLLRPLLSMLNGSGVRNDQITIFIASGTHLPMREDEYKFILDEDIINRFRINPHNCDDITNLYEIGKTFRGTPVRVNRMFLEQDLKIVIGDIELHHFAGFSGGVKSAAIGLCGRDTINTNHKLLLDERSILGNFVTNPLRQDIEEIGRMIPIDLALNAVLNEEKQILEVFFGDPAAVLQAGMQSVRELCQVPITSLYDLVIASAGGYPKDINLYQAQKAMTHASFFCKPGGTILLVAECREGAGSSGYVDFMQGVSSAEQVIEKFSRSEFRVGPHKAFQIARIQRKWRLFLLSSLPQKLTDSLLISSIRSNEDITQIIQDKLPPQSRIAILPYATACLPQIKE